MALDGKVAVVMGASRGLGEAMAVYLAKAGATVVVASRTEEQTDPRLPGTIYSVAKQIEEAGGKALAVQTDVRDLDSAQACIDRTVAELGRLDIVVNNAAVRIPGDIENTLLRHVELTWQINIRAPIMVCKMALPHLKAAGGGHVINISSGASRFPGPGPYPDHDMTTRGDGVLYGMSKIALERFTQGWAREVAQYKIAVNTLSPRQRIRTPGNSFVGNDRDHPVLEFDDASPMGKAAVWICEQDPARYTGNITYDLDILEAAAVPR
jgi:NAD(P)-dependent dehydrogenase (short-subunit alcohol dehydrogenase family)